MAAAQRLVFRNCTLADQGLVRAGWWLLDAGWLVAGRLDRYWLYGDVAMSLAMWLCGYVARAMDINSSSNYVIDYPLIDPFLHFVQHWALFTFQ